VTDTHFVQTVLVAPSPFAYLVSLFAHWLRHVGHCSRFISYFLTKQNNFRCPSFI